jgi:hypothetical protein
VAAASSFSVVAEVVANAEIYSAEATAFVANAAVTIAALAHVAAAAVAAALGLLATVTFDVAQLLISVVAATAAASSFGQCKCEVKIRMLNLSAALIIVKYT